MIEIDTLAEKLRGAGLRPTQQRLALAQLLFENGDRHVCAEDLHAEAVDARVAVSLAGSAYLRFSKSMKIFEI